MHEPSRLTAIVDVGAAAIDTPPSYQSMFDAGLCAVIGFEPQTTLWPRDCKNRTILPDVIGDGAPALLRIFSAPGMASLLAPEWSMLDALSPIAAGGAEWGKLLHTSNVQTRRLDDIAIVTHIDLLRMDAQGAELMILQGAGHKLTETVCVQTEVSFNTLYVGQPMFGDIHDFLTAKGFIFHTFTEFQVRTIGPSRGKGRQIIQADAVYVKDFRDMSGWSAEQLKHMALIARWCFGSDDLAHRCVKQLENIDADHSPSQGSYSGSNGIGAMPGSNGRGPGPAGDGLEQR
jgi:FkbM family methyltransferase